MNYTEQQSIPPMWRMLIFGGITLFMGFVFLMIYLTEWDTMPPDEKLSMLTLLIGPVSVLIIFFIRLEVRITSTTFEYMVHPFRKKYKVIPFSKIAGFELSKPKVFKSFKGIGTHRNLNQTELNFGGKYLLAIRFTSGKILSVSSDKPQELKSFLMNLPAGGPNVKVEV
jgi:hypothetical protein